MGGPVGYRTEDQNHSSAPSADGPVLRDVCVVGLARLPGRDVGVGEVAPVGLVFGLDLGPQHSGCAGHHVFGYARCVHSVTVPRTRRLEGLAR